MKLQTQIPARRDGTVTVAGLDGQDYVFAADVDGELVCDVAHEPTIAHLINTDNFFPVDPADVALSLSLAAGPGALDGEGTDNDLDEDLDENENPDAPPVEVPTLALGVQAPAAARPRTQRNAK